MKATFDAVTEIALDGVTGGATEPVPQLGGYLGVRRGKGLLRDPGVGGGLGGSTLGMLGDESNAPPGAFY